MVGLDHLPQNFILDFYVINLYTNHLGYSKHFELDLEKKKEKKKKICLQESELLLLNPICSESSY